MEGRAVVLAHDILSERAHGGDLMSLVVWNLGGCWELCQSTSRSLAVDCGGRVPASQTLLEGKADLWRLFLDECPCFELLYKCSQTSLDLLVRCTIPMWPTFNRLTNIELKKNSFYLRFMRTPRSEFGDHCPLLWPSLQGYTYFKASHHQTSDNHWRDDRITKWYISTRHWMNGQDAWPCACIAGLIYFPVRTKRSCWHVCLGLAGGQREAQDCLLPITPEA